MKLGLSIRPGSRQAAGLRSEFSKTREIGFDSIDIFADPLEIDVKEKRLIKDECDRAGLPIMSVACVAVGLIDFNPSIQRFHARASEGISRYGLSVRGQERAAGAG